jgi:hypothetical protein
MKNGICIKYYRVFKYDTVVTEIPVNDFDPCKRAYLLQHAEDLHYAITSHTLSLPPDGAMFYDFPQKYKAMEKAKAEALEYINLMVNEGEAAMKKLLQYRMDHYEDLNINLVDANIRRVKSLELAIDKGNLYA